MSCAFAASLSCAAATTRCQIREIRAPWARVLLATLIATHGRSAPASPPDVISDEANRLDTSARGRGQALSPLPVDRVGTDVECVDSVPLDYKHSPQIPLNYDRAHRLACRR